LARSERRTISATRFGMMFARPSWNTGPRVWRCQQTTSWEMGIVRTMWPRASGHRRDLEHRPASPQRIDENVASRAGESHSHALLDPYVSLSAHTAPDVRSLTCKRSQWANKSGSARTTRASQSLAPLVRARSRLYLLRPYRTR
jgi:hypothetical protein